MAYLHFLAGRPRPGEPPAEVDRPVRAPGGPASAPGSVLQRHGASFDLSRTADPDAAGRLLLRHPVGGSVVRRGSPEPDLSLVLPAVWKATCRTARPSPRTATAASGRATCCVSCSIRSCAGAIIHMGPMAPGKIGPQPSHLPARKPTKVTCVQTPQEAELDRAPHVKGL